MPPDFTRSLLAVCLLGLAGLPGTPASAAASPNILWLSAEDHGPHLGCYGDGYAVTPNVDAFAKRSLRYTHAISTAPVCAPARTTIIAGMYAPALGAHHMRSEVQRPKWHRLFPEYLRDAGYHTTNSSKTDYNFFYDSKAVWDESSRKAHYKNRPEGKPFFAVFNQTCTHESQIRNKNDNPSHDPAKAPLPPYHPDTPEVRKDWAQYYDRLGKMDEWFAKQIAALEEAGLQDDTIVFFWADHGSGMPRGKRYAGWSGVHVPLIVHIPDKWKHLRPEDYSAGGISGRLVGFVDFAPTILSLAGLRAPAFHQGRAFAGKFIAEAPEFSFGFRGRMDERPDSSRSVFNNRFAYIRNFMPHLPHGQSLHYQLETPTTRVWRRLFRQGKLNAVQARFWQPKAPEELYDLQADPHETKNLAGDPAHQATLQRFRGALKAHMQATHDLGVFPEGMFHDKCAELGVTPGELIKSLPDFPWDDLHAARDLALHPSTDAQQVKDLLNSGKDASIRYWAALYVLYRGEHFAHKVHGELKRLLSDSSRSVQVAAAETLAFYPPDEETRDLAMLTLVANADPETAGPYHSVAALNALEHLPTLPKAVKDRIAALPKQSASAPKRANAYAERMHKHIFRPLPD
ncbi:MAG: sulfatase [Akkermansiaceae bacterium]|nr:sulfatase [Akkermansiaceae bacterium]